MRSFYSSALDDAGSYRRDVSRWRAGLHGDDGGSDYKGRGGQAMRRKKAEGQVDPLRHLRVAGLFAGIGGIERGLHLGAEAQGASCETRLLCEIDTAAIAVLDQHFIEPAKQAHRPIEFATDITKLDRLPRDVNIVTAGFPCQDLSQAGKTAGVTSIQKNAKKARKAGLRSGLVGQVFRLLEERIDAGSPVEWVLIENVPFMLQLSRGKALELILDEFEALDYAWAYRVVDAMSQGLPQRRERVYLLAHHRGSSVPTDDLPAQVLLTTFGKPQAARKWEPEQKSFGFYWTEGIRGLGAAVDAVPTLKGGSTIGIPSPPAIVLPSLEVITPSIEDAEELQGFLPGWTQPAERVGRASLRWKLVGNAVSVAAATWIGERLFDPRPFMPPTRTPVDRTGAWPLAAWNDGTGRFEAESFVSTWPVHRKQISIHVFLADPSRRDRVRRPLSARATAGFLDRARQARLRFPDRFLDVLQAHLAIMGGPPASKSPRRSREKSVAKASA